MNCKLRSSFNDKIKKFIDYSSSIVKMITTIKISEEVKNQLDRMKESERETYEEVILKLMNAVKKQKREQRQLLIEGCKVMAEESLKIAKEFEAIEEDFDWEWKDGN